jgi:hypothetical protein
MRERTLGLGGARRSSLTGALTYNGSLPVPDMRRQFIHKLIRRKKFNMIDVAAPGGAALFYNFIVFVS